MIYPTADLWNQKVVLVEINSMLYLTSSKSPLTASMEKRRRHAQEIKFGSSIQLRRPKQPIKAQNSQELEDNFGKLEEKYDGEVSLVSM